MAKEPKNAEVVDQTNVGKDGFVHNKPGEHHETVTTVNEVNLGKTRDVVQERIDKLSEQNEEGHAKNMKAIEEAHKPKEKAEGDPDTDSGSEDRVGGADPKLGREDNANTPRVNKDGSKSWGPPGVAGAPRA